LVSEDYFFPIDCRHIGCELLSHRDVILPAELAADEIDYRANNIAIAYDPLIRSQLSTAEHMK
jgi:hypothetical protein